MLRNYKTKLIDNAIARARTIPRSKALERVEKSNNGKRRPVLSVEYHPSLPALSSILKRHWRVMSQDPYLKEVFPLPPIVAYIRPANLKDKLIRARIPGNREIEKSTGEHFNKPGHTMADMKMTILEKIKYQD